MARERIFVGSSTEGRALAASIVKALDDFGFLPVPWWENFPPGITIIDRLLELPHEVDGAVFVFTADDQVMSGDTALPSPRDNVVLEWALFAATLGKPLTLMVVDRSVKLPSDVVGLVYQTLGGHQGDVAQDVAQYFQRHFAQRPETAGGSTRTLIDHDTLSKVMAETWPLTWHSRLLYLGADGGRSWLRLSADFAYKAEARRAWFRRSLQQIVSGIQVRTLVSMGPGDALLDRDFVTILRGQNPRLEYLPIDISDYLLHNALMQLSSQIRIPCGILSDFEDRLGWIGLEIKKLAPPPRLWAMVGNTLGNLDGSEGQFLRTLRLELGEGDSVLLGISSKGSTWALERDNRASLAGYDAKHRAFLAGAISLRTGESGSKLVETFDERVRITAEDVSDVPGATSLVLRDRATERRISRVTRYDPEPFLGWLRTQGYALVKEIAAERPETSSIVGDLLVLAQKA